jgi:hypothetical protein
MSLRIPAPHWETESGHSDGKCRKFPADPVTKFDPWFDDMEESEKVCNGTYDGVVCPIRHRCLIFALVNNEHYGVWGGLLPEQRHWLRQTYRHKRHQPRPEWRYENAPSYESIRADEAARKADREAEGSRGDEEAPDRAAG